MWRLLPASPSLRTWVLSVRFMNSALGTERNIHLPCFENGKSLQKPKLSFSQSSCLFGSEVNPKRSNSYEDIHNNVDRTEKEESLVTDKFGSISLNGGDIFSNHSSTFACDVPHITSPSGTEMLAVPAHSYYESPKAGYDTSEIMLNFAEAAADPKYGCSSHWISALEKASSDSANGKTTLLKLREKKFTARHACLRQRHLLARWRASNRNSSKQWSSRETIKLSSSSRYMEKGEAEKAYALCNATTTDVDAVSSAVVHVTDNLPNASHGNLRNNHKAKHLLRVQDENFVLVEKVSVYESKIRRDRFDPVEVRARVAPVRVLRHLVKEKDIENLRAILNEYRWPDIHSLRSFISDLFRVFIDFASDVDEVKLLMWDFAATDNRAFVADSVTLSFLERIIREEGLQSASTYAKHHRDLFLVRPPMEREKTALYAVYNKLFVTAIESSDSKDAQCFIDLLLRLGYLEDESSFLVLCLSEELKRNGFSRAYHLWCSNTKNYRNSAGAYLLIRDILKNMAFRDQEKHLANLLDFSIKYNHPYAALGELIVELVIANRLSEAQILMEKLTLSGHHLRIPLNRLKGRSENLVVIERFGEIISNSLLAEQRVRHRNKTCKKCMLEFGSQKFADNISLHLVAKWRSHRKHKFIAQNCRTKRFVLDPVQMDELTSCIQDVWTDLAEISNDLPALDRMYTWCSKNGVQLGKRVLKKCKKIYKRNGLNCPFVTSYKV